MLIQTTGTSQKCNPKDIYMQQRIIVKVSKVIFPLLLAELIPNSGSLIIKLISNAKMVIEYQCYHTYHSIFSVY